MAEQTFEPYDVCPICRQVLRPDDDVVPYANGLAHRKCKEEQNQE
jgi:hypothetical protein